MKITRGSHEITLTAEEIFEAHKEFVVNWMKDTVQEIDDNITDEKAADVADRAYDIYSYGEGLTEYEAVEHAVDEYQEEILDNVDVVIKEAEQIEGKLKDNEEIEVGINEETKMVAISIYKPKYEAAFHEKDVISMDSVDLDSLWSKVDEKGWNYVPVYGELEQTQDKEQDGLELD
jgi:hypothetical protein